MNKLKQMAYDYGWDKFLFRMITCAASPGKHNTVWWTRGSITPNVACGASLTNTE